MKGDPRIQRHGLIQDSRFWFSDSFHQWNLISGFQLLVGFRIPRDVFWNPNPRIPHSTSKSFPRILISFLGKEGLMRSLLYSATYARMNFELRITDEGPARSIRWTSSPGQTSIFHMRRTKLIKIKMFCGNV